jgi:hypothetical protein
MPEACLKGGRSWTCGTGRTGLDLPTVRGAYPQGQFEPARLLSARPVMLERVRTDDLHSGNRPFERDTPTEPVILWRTGCPVVPVLLASGHRTHPKHGQARSIQRPCTLHTLWTKVWIGTSGPTDVIRAA